MKARFKIIITLVLIIGMVQCYHSESGSILPSAGVYFQGLIAKSHMMKEGYTEAMDGGGRLEVLTYNHHLTRLGKDVEKHITVYLPAGYDPAVQYNILYMHHGTGGDHTTYTGTADEPKAFTYSLDHMIANGDMEPTIVVCPENSFTYDAPEDSLNDYLDEFYGTVIPLVEQTYLTYANKDTSPESLENSRTHRAAGGFSLGGLITWRNLNDHNDWFSQYMPISCPAYLDEYNEISYPYESRTWARVIEENVRDSGYAYDYQIYAASGEYDYLRTQTCQQVQDLLEYSDLFQFQKEAEDIPLSETLSDDAFTGNVHFFVEKDLWHSSADTVLYFGYYLPMMFPPDVISIPVVPVF